MPAPKPPNAPELLEPLDPARIRAALSDAGRQRLTALEIHDTIDSTNDHLMRAALAGAPSGTLCLAERQTAGRGRRGRTWISPPGCNLYGSLLWRYPLPPAALGGLSLAIGATLAETLDAAGARQLSLKWPNDLRWRDRKLAGLLIEIGGETQGPSHLVVGLGLNLRMSPGQGAAIDQPWARLDEALGGRPIERNALTAAIFGAFMATLDDYGRAGLAPFLDRWRRFDTLLGQRVGVRAGDWSATGIHRGLAPDGALLLETAEGRLLPCHAGEVSLRAPGAEARRP